jgi:hypothetical protein
LVGKVRDLSWPTVTGLEGKDTHNPPGYLVYSLSSAGVLASEFVKRQQESTQLVLNIPESCMKFIIPHLLM